ARASSRYPASWSRAMTSAHDSAEKPARASRLLNSAAVRSRRASASTATSSASSLRDSLLDLPGDGRRVGRRHSGRQEPRRDELIRPHECLKTLEDLLTDVGMLTQEGGGILATLPEPLVLEAEIRARLLDDLAFERGV